MQLDDLDHLSMFNLIGSILVSVIGQYTQVVKEDVLFVWRLLERNLFLQLDIVTTPGFNASTARFLYVLLQKEIVSKNIIHWSPFHRKTICISVTLIIITSNDCIDPQAIILQVNLITSDVLEHKWRASLKTILILYE